MEQLLANETKEVLQNCSILQQSLLNLKETIQKMEENNTQIETGNPYVSTIDNFLADILILKDELYETIEG
jgi:hypothetical protein